MAARRDAEDGYHLLSHPSQEHELHDISSAPRFEESESSFSTTLRHGDSPAGLGISGFRSSSNSSPNAKQCHVTATASEAYPSSAHNGAKVFCRSNRHVWASRWHWTSTTILVLSLFSTIFSGIYLAIAIRRPTYEGHIGEGGKLTAANASLLTALFAKLTELSFVTVFVAFIGQVLSRRAFMHGRHQGVNLAELSIRTWLLQPGSIITQPTTVRYAILSSIGILSMSAALSSMLYTTAAEALVSPALRLGDDRPTVLTGLVRASFFNVKYLGDTCDTFGVNDPVAGADTCQQVDYAGAGFGDYQVWLKSFRSAYKNESDKQATSYTRPAPLALFQDTNVQGAWIDGTNPRIGDEGGRKVNNVTMAMPHIGVIQASADEINKIPQPQGSDGRGTLHLRASLPSPYVNVMCADMTEQEISPLIYMKWPNNTHKNVVNETLLWPRQLEYVFPQSPWLNRTAVDSIFQFGQRYARRPPAFIRLPKDYNTIVDHSQWLKDVNATRDHVYLLGKMNTTAARSYFMCSMKAGLTSSCSTDLRQTSTGSTVQAICEDASDQLQYSRSNPKAPRTTSIVDWISIADEWANALSLNAGVNDGAAAIARLLTEFFPRQYTLTDMPSTAETLAVMASNTLLLGTRDAPFAHYWNYTASQGPGEILSEDKHEACAASFASQQYASGATASYQNAFYVVLVVVLLCNLIALGWFAWHGGLVTDFSEPQNMFSLTINSPPSDVFAGSCGGGPNGQQYQARMVVRVDDDHVYVSTKGEALRRRPLGDTKVVGSPLMDYASKLSARKSLL